MGYAHLLGIAWDDDHPEPDAVVDEYDTPDFEDDDFIEDEVVHDEFGFSEDTLDLEDF